MNSRRREKFIISGVSSSHTNVITSDLGSYLKSKSGRDILRQANNSLGRRDEKTQKAVEPLPVAEKV